MPVRKGIYIFFKHFAKATSPTNARTAATNVYSREKGPSNTSYDDGVSRADFNGTPNSAVPRQNVATQYELMLNGKQKHKDNHK